MFPIVKIIKSRFKKPKSSELQEIERKKRICKACEYNSLNRENIPLRKKILIYLSDMLSYVTNSKEDDTLGNCTACESCSIYYKIIMDDECKHPKGNQWKIDK